MFEGAVLEMRGEIHASPLLEFLNIERTDVVTDYYFPKHVFLCQAEDRFVALDLKSDKYISFEGQRADVLSALIAPGSYEDMSARSAAVTAPAIVDETAHLLVQHGLLTRDRREGKPLALTTFDRARDRLVRGFSEKRPRISPIHLWTFLFACIKSSQEMRWKSIEKIVYNAHKRKINTNEKSMKKEVDLDKARSLVAIFNALRPIYPRNYLCTFDSLAMIKFLAAYNIFPTWVFGVEVDPFQAHCWIQEKDVVFNDHVDMIRAYTPVMTV